MTFLISQWLLFRDLPDLQIGYCSTSKNPLGAVLHCPISHIQHFFVSHCVFNFLQRFNNRSQLNLFKTFYVCRVDCAMMANGNFFV